MKETGSFQWSVHLGWHHVCILCMFTAAFCQNVDREKKCMRERERGEKDSRKGLR